MSILSSSLIPTGALPKWMLLVAIIAVANTIQNLITLELTKRVYNARPEEVTSLSSRTFAIWTFTSGVVRFYAAYNLNNKAIYQITLWTYIIAITHFLSEYFVFGTLNIGPGLAAPVCVATISLIWMTAQYDYYTNTNNNVATKKE
ncbi:5830_t:CDS:2 [Ambispora gerdemannii]|uniref:5830_t:CDS:1 n=1 Tax=Ambispora gerdemannii TaxID=144530 RepID=A0A9N8YWW8_9GLOM|nr:5830_t:CDS:2 [Ambispora gerdemannii]